MSVEVCLRERTADHVVIYFQKARSPEIRKWLPQQAQTLEQALEAYRRTLLPGATSFGRTIYADGVYVGDIWCYCIDPHETPNCMLSLCIFDGRYRSCGIGTQAVGLFVREILQRDKIRTIGAFSFADNAASIRVLEKNGFRVLETFVEDARESCYLQWGN